MTLSNPPAGNGPMLLGIVWTFTTLALMSMLLRLYVRCFVIRAAGRDDYVIALCFVRNETGSIHDYLADNILSS